MRTIALYSVLLLAGLLLSQTLPVAAPGLWSSAHLPLKLATMVCLAYIMIRVGLEFRIDKSQIRRYGWDYVVAATAAAFPWVLCAAFFIYAMSPREAWASWDAWTQSLLIGRFAAPTSAGILFSMLAAAGLASTWVFRKARILAIFDDLDTVLLMIPLKVMLIGMRWQLAAVGFIAVWLVWVAWRHLHSRRWPADWRWVLGYSVLITAASELVYVGSGWIDASSPVHLEVLLPAFALGCVIAGHPDESDAVEKRVTKSVTATFLVLVGLSMPPLTAGAAPGGIATLIGGEWRGWGAVVVQALCVTVLSNLGKMFAVLCYRREASWRERLAVSIGMWPRGEVGAGVLVVSLSYGLGGPVVTVAILSLILNLALTGVFIAAVRVLVERSAALDESPTAA